MDNLVNEEKKKKFGFIIKNPTQDKLNKNTPSFIPQEEDDAYINNLSHNNYYGFNYGSQIKDETSEREQINIYREVALHPEVDSAIEDIVNEAIASDEVKPPVELFIGDQIANNSKLVSELKDSFEKTLELLNFAEDAHAIFRKWYIEGRIYYHLIPDQSRLQDGIVDVRLIDPINITKKVDYSEHKDETTGATVLIREDEYYLYSEVVQTAASTNSNISYKISPDSIAYVSSGWIDPKNKRVLSYLHKGVRFANMLRQMEDAVVIYRLARAPERRIFYIDVGDMQPTRIEQYMNAQISKFSNKITYDEKSGLAKSNVKHTNILEDYWFPRKSDGKGTEVTTLGGGENLGEIDDILFFKKELYKSLNVPYSRLDQENQFTLGRSGEISRDEVKFQKFINRLRKKFSNLFLSIMRADLILKGIIKPDEWSSIKPNLFFNYLQDSAFAELKELDVLTQRANVLNDLSPFVGLYFSVQQVRKDILRMDDTQIKELDKQLEKEKLLYPPNDLVGTSATISSADITNAV